VPLNPKLKITCQFVKIREIKSQISVPIRYIFNLELFQTLFILLTHFVCNHHFHVNVIKRVIKRIAVSEGTVLVADVQDDFRTLIGP